MLLLICRAPTDYTGLIYCDWLCDNTGFECIQRTELDKNCIGLAACTVYIGVDSDMTGDDVLNVTPDNDSS